MGMEIGIGRPIAPEAGQWRGESNLIWRWRGSDLLILTGGFNPQNPTNAGDDALFIYIYLVEKSDCEPQKN